MKITSLLFIITILWNASLISAAKKVAIIGAGTAGAISAYYLNKLIPDIEIDIYEHIPEEIDPYARLTVHSYNQYVKEIIEAVQLEMIPLPSFPPHARPVVYDKTYNRPLAVNRFFKSEKAILKPICDEIIKKFQEIYQLQNKERTFITVFGLLQSIHRDFTEYAKTSIEKFLESKIDQEEDLNKVKNLVKALIMFGPPIDLNANAFYSLMMLSFSEITGNIQIYKNEENKFISDLIRVSKVDVFYHREVVKITRKNSGYRITSKAKNILKPSTRYDSVIIATYITKNIVFDLIEKPKFIEYVNTYLHAVKGLLNQRITGMQSGLFHIIPAIYDVGKSRKVVKLPPGSDHNFYVMADKKLSIYEIREYINPLYEFSENDIGIIQYLPKYFDYNLVDYAGFILAENLYNVKAMESAVPLMEMVAISAKNIALLIKNEIIGQANTPRKRPGKNQSVGSGSKSLKIGKSKSKVKSEPY